MRTSSLEFRTRVPRRRPEKAVSVKAGRGGEPSYSSLGFTFPASSVPPKKSYLGVEESYRYWNQLLVWLLLGVVRIQTVSMGAAWREGEGAARRGTRTTWESRGRAGEKRRARNGSARLSLGGMSCAREELRKAELSARDCQRSPGISRTPEPIPPLLQRADPSI